MKVRPLAGKPTPPPMLANIPKLVMAYYADVPDFSVPAQRVGFGTSGHRSSALGCSFNEWCMLAITQAICEHRKSKSINGPLFIGST